MNNKAKIESGSNRGGSILIFKPRKNAKRIKVFIPYHEKEIREAFKKLNSSYYHLHQKLWSIVNTLRHSFATHCIEDNINMRYLQNMLGHNSPKTTELYTKTIKINNKNITSPLDNIIKNHNLQP